MSTERDLSPDARPALGRSRADVLDLLRTAGRPLGAGDVAQRAGLHHNTARFHLEALVDAGLATRESEGRQTPGRPRVSYTATEAAPAGPRRYGLLSQMLASLIAGTMPEPSRAAEEAGREWGEFLTEQPPPYQRVSPEQAVESLIAALADLGFAPQAEPDGEGRYVVNLRQCPFREVAEQHQQVICALHLGLMRGTLARMRAPVTASRLDPFVEPGLCVARVTTSGSPDTGAH
jgi:predicted ArsR family transcriptional regulator